MGIRAGSVHLECDDEVTASCGRCGVVTGIDPDKLQVAFVDDAGVVHRVTVEELLTVNQQETRPRAGKLDPPTVH